MRRILDCFCKGIQIQLFQKKLSFKNIKPEILSAQGKMVTCYLGSDMKNVCFAVTLE